MIEDNYDEPLLEDMKSEEHAEIDNEKMQEIRRTMGSTVGVTEQDLQMIYQHQTGTYTNIF